MGLGTDTLESEENYFDRGTDGIGAAASVLVARPCFEVRRMRTMEASPEATG